MNSEGLKILSGRIALYVFLGLSVTGCMRSTSTPAPVRSVDERTISGGSSVSAGKGNTADTSINYQRNYENIPKGSYGGATWRVKRGDTLFYIAWITGNDFRYLAARNNIARPWNLSPGQVIHLNGRGAEAATSDATRGLPQHPSVSQIQTPGIDSASINAYSGKNNVNGTYNKKDAIVSKIDNDIRSGNNIHAINDSNVPVKQWKWPADGKIIEGFLAAEGGNKGIDIAASRGQSVFATAKGRIVYAGNALRGYGNLIIIKHDDDYLSAYAHNDSMLVREQQEVKAGQKIATMGSSGTSSVRLHFEIRYKGKSVNPLRYLPQR